MFRGSLPLFLCLSLAACSQKETAPTAANSASYQCSQALFQHQQIQIHGLSEVSAETFSQFIRSKPNQNWFKAAMAETWTDTSEQNLTTSISVNGQQDPSESHPTFQVECALNQNSTIKRKLLSNLGSISTERNGYLKAGYALDATIPFQTMARNVTGTLITESKTRKLNSNRMETLISYRYPTAIQLFLKTQKQKHNRLNGSYDMKFFISTHGSIPVWAISQSSNKKTRDSSSHAQHETFEMFFAN